MSELPTRHVQMPPTAEYPSGHKLPLRDRVLVVIGANGSGKTRFGAWLESQNITIHHRVSAHRSLKFPERVQPTDLEEAERHLFYGNPANENLAHYRQHNRWQNNPATALLDDFAPLVTVMVSESFAVSDQYRVAMKAVTEYVAPPKTRMDQVKEIWEAVLPDRELVLTGSRIETRNRKDSSLYHAKEMSDGERGIFHLIGEALSVPKDGVFVVDEPELHLHRAIQARLWDAVEAARPDCTFVYITHDLGFAASRKDANKVWLREYTNGKWDWEEVPETDAFPESLLLEVMGSRRPIVVCRRRSQQPRLFHLRQGLSRTNRYSVWVLRARGPLRWQLRATAKLHHNKCGRLVDNDGRSEADIKMLKGFGIAVLPVALVENLFLLESRCWTLPRKSWGTYPAEAVAKVKERRVYHSLKTNAVHVDLNLTRQEIETGLRTFGKGGDGAEALTAAFRAHVMRRSQRRSMQSGKKK